MSAANRRARLLTSASLSTTGDTTAIVSRSRTEQPTAIGRPHAVDLGLLVVAVVAVSFSAPLVREAAAPALIVAMYRNLFASAVLVPASFLRHRPEVLRLRTSTQERRLSILAGVTLAAHFATWVPSLSFTSVASSVALVATQPIWAAVIARVRGERVPVLAWWGIGIAFSGTIVLAGVDLSFSGRALFGDMLALLGGILAAVYVTIGSAARRTLTTTVYTTVCYSVAAALLLVACVIGGKALLGYDAKTWWIFVAITIGPQLLGHSVVNLVLRTTSATVVSVAILFEIVGATLIAWWWFGETPSAGAYPAALLIAVGVVLVVLSGREPAAPVD
jgi:drug/metabolite transporter (DMT)-like permease